MKAWRLGEDLAEEEEEEEEEKEWKEHLKQYIRPLRGTNIIVESLNTLGISYRPPFKFPGRTTEINNFQFIPQGIRTLIWKLVAKHISSELQDIKV